MQRSSTREKTFNTKKVITDLDSIGLPVLFYFTVKHCSFHTNLDLHNSVLFYKALIRIYIKKIQVTTEQCGYCP